MDKLKTESETANGRFESIVERIVRFLIWRIFSAKKT